MGLRARYMTRCWWSLLSSSCVGLCRTVQRSHIIAESCDFSIRPVFDVLGGCRRGVEVNGLRRMK